MGVTNARRNIIIGYDFIMLSKKQREIRLDRGKIKIEAGFNRDCPISRCGYLVGIILHFRQIHFESVHSFLDIFDGIGI